MAVTPTIGSMVALTGLLTGAQEAKLTGLPRYAITRARQDPTHPANGERAVQLGGSTGAPEAEVRAWWAARTRPVGADGRPLVTRRQWAALRAIAGGAPAGEADSGYVIDRLTAGGWLAGGELTDRARTALAHTMDGTTRQEPDQRARRHRGEAGDPLPPPARQPG